jgi:flagellar biosynthesis protein FliP
MEISFTSIEWILSLLFFTPFIRTISCLTVLRYGLGAGKSGFGIVVLTIALVTALSHPIDKLNVKYRSESGSPRLTLASPQDMKARVTPEVLEQLSSPELAEKTSEDGRIATGVVLSELKNGLELGIALTIPLIVVDLLAAHLLTLLGVTTLSLAIIVVPLKLIVFTTIGGWEMLIQKLLAGY